MLCCALLKAISLNRLFKELYEQSIELMLDWE